MIFLNKINGFSRISVLHHDIIFVFEQNYCWYFTIFCVKFSNSSLNFTFFVLRRFILMCFSFGVLIASKKFLLCALFTLSISLFTVLWYCHCKSAFFSSDVWWLEWDPGKWLWGFQWAYYMLWYPVHHECVHTHFQIWTWWILNWWFWNFRTQINSQKSLIWEMERACLQHKSVHMM